MLYASRYELDVSARNYALSSDGTLLAVVLHNAPVVRVWDLLERQWTRTFSLPCEDTVQDRVDAVAFVENGTCIATTQGTHFRIWSIYDGRMKKEIQISAFETLDPEDRAVRELQVSPDGRTVVVHGCLYAAVISVPEEKVLFYQVTGRRNYDNPGNLRSRVRREAWYGLSGVSSDFKFLFASRFLSKDGTEQAAQGWKTVVDVWSIPKRCHIRQVDLENVGGAQPNERTIPQSSWHYENGVCWLCPASKPNAFCVSAENERASSVSLRNIAIPPDQRTYHPRASLDEWKNAVCKHGVPYRKTQDEIFLIDGHPSCWYDSEPDPPGYTIGICEAEARSLAPSLLRRARESAADPVRAMSLLQRSLELAQQACMLEQASECRALLLLHAVDQGLPASAYVEHVRELGAQLGNLIGAPEQLQWTRARAFYQLEAEDRWAKCLDLAFTIMVKVGCKEIDVFTSAPKASSLSAAELESMASVFLLCTEPGSRVEIVDMTNNRVLSDTTLPHFLEKLEKAAKDHAFQAPLREVRVCKSALSDLGHQKLLEAVANYPRRHAAPLDASLLESFSSSLFMGYTELESLLASESTRLIGAGSTSDIYRASMDGKFVAIKKLVGRGFTKAAVSAFRSEIQVLAEVPEHPNTIKMLHVVADPRGIAIVQPLARASLRDHIDHTKEIDCRKSLHLLHGVARGLAHIHDHGVEHRDLSPSNILLLSDTHAVLSDFGSSKVHAAVISLSAQRSGAEGAADEVGALLYRAPEALIRVKKMRRFQPSTKSDVWALALVINEIFSQKRPYKDEVDDCDLVDFLRCEVARGEFHPEAAEEIPSTALRGIVARCLSFDPANRPSARDVAEALRNALDGTGGEGSSRQTAPAS